MEAHAACTALALPSPSLTSAVRALTDEAGRRHATPTPDPDPRDSGLCTLRALRSSEPVLRQLRPHSAAGATLPGRAQGLHSLRLRPYLERRRPLLATVPSARPGSYLNNLGRDGIH
jgi:hypothetical protein